MPRSKQQIRATRAKERKFVEVLVESGGDAALALKSAGYTTKYPADLKRRILERPGVREYFDTLMAAQIETARAGGEGDLAALLAGNDTWEVS